MTSIREIEVEDSQGNLVTHIIEEFAPNEFRSMPKAVWDELEAAKENGTIS